MSTNLKLGLRFSRSQARVLRNLADSLRGQPGVDVGLYEAAADSARDGEPLVVHCSHPDEVRKMASMFVLVGVKRPAIEELN